MRKRLQKLILWAICRIYPPIEGRAVIRFPAYGVTCEYRKSLLQVFAFKLVDLIGWVECVMWPRYTGKEKSSAVTIEKQLDRAGYVQHPQFWQKGFVRCAKDRDKWEVWHNIGDHPALTFCTEEDLLDTLKYFERI